MKYYKIKPVLPCVDVEVGEDECVEGTLLCRPLHHRLEPVLQEQDCKSFARARLQKFCKSKMAKVLPKHLSNLVASAVTLIPGKVLTVLCTVRFSALTPTVQVELPVGELQWVLRWGVDYVLQTFLSPTNWSILQ